MCSQKGHAGWGKAEMEGRRRWRRHGDGNEADSGGCGEKEGGEN